MSVQSTNSIGLVQLPKWFSSPCSCISLNRQCVTNLFPSSYRLTPCLAIEDSFNCEHNNLCNGRVYAINMQYFAMMLSPPVQLSADALSLGLYGLLMGGNKTGVEEDVIETLRIALYRNEIQLLCNFERSQYRALFKLMRKLEILWVRYWIPCLIANAFDFVTFQDGSLSCSG